MGISQVLKTKMDALSEEDKERLVRMGWEDRTPFEAIQNQFGFSQNEFIRFMRAVLERRVFNRWRRRANQQGHLKHQAKRGVKVMRFKCSRQKADGSTKGWKLKPYESSKTSSKLEREDKKHFSIILT